MAHRYQVLHSQQQQQHEQYDRIRENVVSIEIYKTLNTFQLVSSVKMLDEGKADLFDRVRCLFSALLCGDAKFYIAKLWHL